MLLNEILNTALKKGASDIHFTSNSAVFIRVDNDLLPLFDDKIFTTEELLAFVATMIPAERFLAFQQNKIFEYDFRFKCEAVDAFFRGNVFHFNDGIGVALRTISLAPLTLEAIHAPTALKEACLLQNGLVLVTGPTGSGKSTTLAAMIDYINTNFNKHIVTIEDPIEYVHSTKKCLVHQRQVYEHSNSFNDAIRVVLREDPDYILIGELRDLETIRLALTAAETGHLVFATLHTNSAADSIDRMISVFPAAEKELIRSMLANTLRLVVSQRLVKKIGGGRVAAMEVMICNTAIKNLIRDNKVFQIYSAMQMGKVIGMQTMEDSLRNLINLKVITAKEAGILL